jgi:hypothetical protein
LRKLELGVHFSDGLKWSDAMKKQLKQSQRLVAARKWLKTYNGKNIVRGYRKHYGVDLMCAIRELQMLGCEISPDYIKSVQASVLAQQRSRQEKKKRQEDQLAFDRFCDSDDTFYYIVGYTSGGAPYGVTWEEMEHLESNSEMKE